MFTFPILSLSFTAILHYMALLPMPPPPTFLSYFFMWPTEFN